MAMTHQQRIQLSLFVAPDEAAAIEDVRRTFNIRQYELIKSHVTLCREDELEPLDRVLENLNELDHGLLPLAFGAPIRFSEGRGVLMPAIGHEAFQALRQRVLKGVVERPRIHEPHLTLMHPRNSTCDEVAFEQIRSRALPRVLTFSTISLIVQEAWDQPWRKLQEFELRGS